MRPACAARPGPARSNKKRAEDGRFDILPVGLGCFKQQVQRSRVKGKADEYDKQAAVEVQQAGSATGRRTRRGSWVRHSSSANGTKLAGSPGCCSAGAEGLALAALNVFGEHGEQTPHQELGDVVRSGGRRLRATLASSARRAAMLRVTRARSGGRVERQRVEPRPRPAVRAPRDRPGRPG